MSKELKKLISKYGNINQFEKKASQIEREKYFLLNRAITLEYNDYRFRYRNQIDFTISEYLNKEENRELLFIEETDDCFSLFSKNKFYAESNILNSENIIFDEFPKRIEFNSLFQYLVYNKSVLFLDRNSAKLSLKSNKKEELLKIDSEVEKYNGTVWTEYKTQIIEKGINLLLEENLELLNTIIHHKNKYFVFKSDYEDWGVKNIQNFLKNEIKKTYNYKNYLGKILTKINLEKGLK